MKLKQTALSSTHHTFSSVHSGDHLTADQLALFMRFCSETEESLIFKYIPGNRLLNQFRLSFLNVKNTPRGFLLAQMQIGEDLDPVVRVHALWLDANLPPQISRSATTYFENYLDLYASAYSAKEIGFYTRRNPHAFMRRLNRTASTAWTLDSYVLTRRARKF